MRDESREIVAAAARQGLVVRLIGSVGVGLLCGDPARGRDHRDIDVVVRRRDVPRLPRLFETLGYEENRHVRLASGGHLAQFFRECVHETSDGRRAHVDDRVDVYVDVFRHHHTLSLRGRLELEREVVSAADALLVKLQRGDADDDDLRDVVELLVAAPLAEHDAPRAINVRRVADLCRRDWGLHRDVDENLRRALDLLGRLGLAPAEEHTARERLKALRWALREAHKTWRWRWRALFGEHLWWRDAVDEADGERIGLREAPPRRVAGR
jgi:hypothetical protein